MSSHRSDRVESRIQPHIGVGFDSRRLGEELWALATAQHGVVGRRQLAALGVSRRVLEAFVRRGHLSTLHLGVYAVGHGALTMRGRWMAAVLACGPGAALSHRSAAALLGLLTDDRSRPHVSVPTQAGRRRPGIAVHRTRSLATVELIEADGIPCTPPARVIVDLAGEMSRRRLERALDQAEVLGVLDARRIDEELRRIARPRGARLLRALLGEHGGVGSFTRSELEERLLALCRRAGLPEPLVNQRVLLQPGAYELVDFQWPSARLVVETDGAAYHDGARAQARDRARDRRLQLAGWTVLRFRWADVASRPERTVAELRAALTLHPPREST